MICGNKQVYRKNTAICIRGFTESFTIYKMKQTLAEVKNGEYEIDGRDVFVD